MWPFSKKTSEPLITYKLISRKVYLESLYGEFLEFSAILSPFGKLIAQLECGTLILRKDGTVAGSRHWVQWKPVELIDISKRKWKAPDSI